MLKQVEKHYILSRKIRVSLSKDMYSLTDNISNKHYNITELFKCKEGFYFKAEEINWFAETPITIKTFILPTYWLGLDVVILINKYLDDENIFWQSKRKIVYVPRMDTFNIIEPPLTAGQEYDLLEVLENGGYKIRNDIGIIEAYKPCIFEEVEDNE